MKYERIDLASASRSRNESERMRTVWTLDMDRYFVGLMLEQVGKWNGVDDHNTFSKHAWNHMTRLFNDKFKFQYDLDVLKNRHKTLRNLYRDVLHLLDQDGFAWDETTKMVTADHKFWDEYIKVHPKSRPFRTKTIPYFHDLCEIYKNTNLEKKVAFACESAISKDSEPQSDSGSLSDGENSEEERLVLAKAEESTVSTFEALHDITLIEDFGLSVTTGLVDDDTLSVLASCHTRMCWQPHMELYFIHLMLDQVKKGNVVEGLFRREAWTEMVASFNAKFGFNHECDVLKNHFKSMRKHYNAISHLLRLEGFIWDDTRKMVIADDRVWQDYIKVDATARQYMTEPAPFYKEMCVICGEPSSDGKDTVSSHSTDQLDESFEAKFGVLVNSFESPNALVCRDDQTGKEGSSHLDFNGTDPTKSKRQLDNPSVSEHSKKARSRDEGIANALHEVAFIVSSLAGKMKEEEEGSSKICIENVVKEIQALPEMDEELVLDACDFLEDERRAKVFLALDVKLRRKWLIRKLRPQN